MNFGGELANSIHEFINLQNLTQIDSNNNNQMIDKKSAIINEIKLLIND